MNRHRLPEEKRLARVDISHGLLTHLLTSGYISDFGEKIRCSDGLPEGAKMVRSYDSGQYVTLVYEHNTFDLVKYGEEIPPLDISYSVEYRSDK